MTEELLVVVGARPNFVKVAPVLHALAAGGRVSARVLHTGQHYDDRLSGSFLEQLRFPTVNHALGVGSGTHAEQTAAVMVGVERVLSERPPGALLVAGDVNSTLAAALAAVKTGIPVIHLEAGLRSGDWGMPEEVNRVLTDRMSSLLLSHSPEALDNIVAEGIPADRLELVGNTMIDSLLELLPAARQRGALERLDLSPGAYVLATLHRPALVDDPWRLRAVIEALGRLGGGFPVLFPAHPRTRAQMAETGLESEGLVRILEPLDYMDFIALEAEARLVITDSGGVQEETSALGVPCLTYRTTTERPVTVSEGTNRLVGTDPGALAAACDEELRSPWPRPAPEIALWDGAAGPRAAAAVEEHLARWTRRADAATAPTGPGAR